MHRGHRSRNSPAECSAVRLNPPESGNRNWRPPRIATPPRHRCPRLSTGTGPGGFVLTSGELARNEGSPDPSKASMFSISSDGLLSTKSLRDKRRSMSDNRNRLRSSVLRAAYLPASGGSLSRPTGSGGGPGPQPHGSISCRLMRFPRDGTVLEVLDTCWNHGSGSSCQKSGSLIMAA